MIRNGDKLPSQDHLIVQEYIEKPFLMEGYKFDLRIYILVTSCDPLKIFLYHDGLVRMGTEKYIPPNESNLVSDTRQNLWFYSFVQFVLYKACTVYKAYMNQSTPSQVFIVRNCVHKQDCFQFVDSFVKIRRRKKVVFSSRLIRRRHSLRLL